MDAWGTPAWEAEYRGGVWLSNSVDDIWINTFWFYPGQTNPKHSVDEALHQIVRQSDFSPHHCIGKRDAKPIHTQVWFWTKLLQGWYETGNPHISDFESLLWYCCVLFGFRLVHVWWNVWIDLQHHLSTQTIFHQRRFSIQGEMHQRIHFFLVSKFFKSVPIKARAKEKQARSADFDLFLQNPPPGTRPPIDVDATTWHEMSLIEYINTNISLSCNYAMIKPSITCFKSLSHLQPVHAYLSCYFFDIYMCFVPFGILWIAHPIKSANF